MRIIAGKYKRHNIIWPEDNINIRPTKDRIRESIFDALGDISNKVTLDLYAGSGAMGLESLSRGSKKCYFVDINPVALRTIKANISKLNINNDEYSIISKTDVEALDIFAQNKIIFDLIILDPPYKKGEYIKIIDFILNNNLLDKNGIIVIESDSDINTEKFVFSKIRDYHYGKINVKILWR